MTIVMKDSGTKKKILDLTHGEVFIDEDGCVCMLIDDMAIRDCDRRAVFLSGGGTFDIDMNENVTIPRKATLTIEM